MALEGSLSVFQLPEILQMISLQNKTGILTEKVRESGVVAPVVVTQKQHDLSEPQWAFSNTGASVTSVRLRSHAARHNLPRHDPSSSYNNMQQAVFIMTFDWNWMGR